MPAWMRNEADWQRFQAALDRSALVVLGRPGHARHPNTGRRRRLVFTSTVSAIAADPRDPLATLFNPAGIGLAGALVELGIASGLIAVTGGTRVFDYFLGFYDRFVLAEVQQAVLPGGRPCFAGGHPRTVLAAAGLQPARFEVVDPIAAFTITAWERFNRR